MQEKAQGFMPIDPNDLPHEGTAAAWLGGAGVLLMHKDTCLFIDPCLFADENGITETGHRAFYPMPLAPEAVPAHAHVLYTHSDGDHMGLPTALRMPQTVEFYAPAPCIRALEEAGITRTRLHLVRPGEVFCLGKMRIAAIAADHAWQVLDPERYGEPFGAADCVGYDILTPEARLLFPGDTRLCPHHLALPDAYDLLALDVSDDPYHLGHENMAKLAKHLSRAALLPLHFGTYDAPDALPHNGSLTELKKLLGKDAARVLPDVMGQWVSLPDEEAYATRMILYLTSHIGGSYKVGIRRFPAPLFSDNGFPDSLKTHWTSEAKVLIIAASPDDNEKNDGIRACFAAAFPMSGLSLGSIDICDARSEELVKKLKEYDVLILSGGHVPTQNAFFRKIGLKEHLQQYKGIVIGISAGTMNCAETVYAQPERPGEAEDAGYQRFIPGLGLTKAMVLPHWQALKDETLDGRRICEDITLPDSMGKTIYALHDGSYILSENGMETLYGEAYRIQNGRREKICENGGCVPL